MIGSNCGNPTRIYRRNLKEREINWLKTLKIDENPTEEVGVSCVLNSRRQNLRVRLGLITWIPGGRRSGWRLTHRPLTCEEHRKVAEAARGAWQVIGGGLDVQHCDRRRLGSLRLEWLALSGTTPQTISSNFQFKLRLVPFGFTLVLRFCLIIFYFAPFLASGKLVAGARKLITRRRRRRQVVSAIEFV